jgi:deoxyribodipyrimidine photolyase-related protein
MEDGRPVGGKLSFDAENRETWPGTPEAPDPPRFEPDDVTLEVGDLLERHFQHHPGELDLERLPATRDDADTLWSWATAQCLPLFGPYEDAMSSRSTGLFHTRISGLLNLHRLVPRDVVDEVLALDIPIASKEGFVRQVLGWREFVHHVHEATDGFRSLPGPTPEITERPGDGGFARWKGEAWRCDPVADEPDGGARPNLLEAQSELPVAYWGRPSGLACLDRVVSDVWREGWSHHITRLMVLSNIATLIGASPRALADWFWIAYIDAYDWVVEPNVLAMGSFATGPLMTTKPYVSGAAYIDRMGDYCTECAFDPKNDCPITSLYWAFLHRQGDRLADNPRMRLPLASERKRAGERRSRDAAVASWTVRTLESGGVLRPPEPPSMED